MYLTPDRVERHEINGKSVEIKVKIVPDYLKASKDVCSYVKKGDSLKPCRPLGRQGEARRPLGITVHNTENIPTNRFTNPAEQYARATYNGNMNGVMVHFYVWNDEIWQLLRENEQGWHAADGDTTSPSYVRKPSHDGNIKLGGNMDTIAIEIIGSDSKENLTSEKTAQILIAYLCEKHNLRPLKDVYTHNYWMYGVDKFVNGAHKNCPLYILDHWQKFLSGINEIYRAKDKIKETAEYKRLLEFCDKTETVARDLRNLLNKIEEGEY